MQCKHHHIVAAFWLFASLLVPASVWADDEAPSELVQLVIGLLADNDKDVRALGFEQVRTEAKGAAATRQFSAQLPKLSAAAQVGLLSALADRGDAAARPAVIELLDSTTDEMVRVAAIGALGALGEPEDTGRLLGLLTSSSEAEREAAKAGLVRLSGEAVGGTVAAQIPNAATADRVTLIKILASRRAHDTVPVILNAALDDDPAVRGAAVGALGQLASAEHLPGMVRAVLRAEAGAERTAAERAIAQVCGRGKDGGDPAAALLAAIEPLGDADLAAMLPALGRVGGPAALERIEAAISNPDAALHSMGVQALCNWPDASVASRLIELSQSDDHSDDASLARKALIRVAPLPDGRPDDERLTLVQRVLDLCTNDDERGQLLERVHAIRTVQALRFLLPFLDQPPLAESASLSIVELAHHRALRDANKPEFYAALDRVIGISADATVIERAKRYKNGQTWVRPKASEKN